MQLSSVVTELITIKYITCFSIVGIGELIPEEQAEPEHRTRVGQTIPDSGDYVIEYIPFVKLVLSVTTLRTHKSVRNVSRPYF